jgi:hypothetical protein
LSRRLFSIAVLITVLSVPALAHAAKPVSYVADTGDPSEVFFKNSGMKLKGSCKSQTTGVKVNSSLPKKKGALFAANAQADPSKLDLDLDSYYEVKRLNSKSDGVDVLGADALNAFDSSVGQLMKVDRKRIVTMDWLAESEGDMLGSDCVFGGTKVVAKRKSPKAVIYRANEGSSEKTIWDGGFEKLRAECASTMDGPELNLFVKAGASTVNVYANSHSDVDQDTSSEQGYSQAEGLFNGEEEMLNSGVSSDHASGQLLINTSNDQVSFDWVASSSHALGRDCLFAATVVEVNSGDDARVADSAFGPQAEEQFFDFGHVGLSFACNATPDINVLVGSAFSGAAAHWGIQADSNGDQSDAAYYREGDDLLAGDVAVLTVEDENALGEMVYTDRTGRFTSLDFMTDEQGIFGQADCAIAGVAQTAAG